MWKQGAYSGKAPFHSGSRWRTAACRPPCCRCLAAPGWCGWRCSPAPSSPCTHMHMATALQPRSATAPRPPPPLEPKFTTSTSATPLCMCPLALPSRLWPRSLYYSSRGKFVSLAEVILNCCSPSRRRSIAGGRRGHEDYVMGCSAPVAVPVGGDGKVGEDDWDGQHAHVQVVEQVCHLVEHALAHLPPCTARLIILLSLQQDPVLHTCIIW